MSLSQTLSLDPAPDHGFVSAKNSDPSGLLGPSGKELVRKLLPWRELSLPAGMPAPRLPTAPPPPTLPKDFLDKDFFGPERPDGDGPGPQEWFLTFLGSAFQSLVHNPDQLSHHGFPGFVRRGRDRLLCAGPGFDEIVPRMSLVQTS